jgi:hypothetical protein
MKNLSKDVTSKIKKFGKKVVEEHFYLSLTSDRNINYLWWMYHKGAKKDNLPRPFIFAFELNLLLYLDMISDEERERLASMLNSEDEDNTYIAVCAIESLRKQRIKIHGQWKNDKSSVSDKFIELAKDYSNFVIKNYSLDKI